MIFYGLYELFMVTYIKTHYSTFQSMIGSHQKNLMKIVAGVSLSRLSVEEGDQNLHLPVSLPGHWTSFRGIRK